MRLAVIGLMLAVIAAIAAALWTIGGPEQSRAEQRDMTRWQDLQALAWHIDCLLMDGKSVTDTSEACPNPPRRNDPFANTPYVVDQVTDQQVTLCAGFETKLAHIAPNLADLTHDPERGCVVIRRHLRR